MISSLPFRRLDERAILPTRGTPFSAGLDLYSIDRVIVPVNARRTIRTGWSLMIADGWYGRIAPRSGMAVRHGIATLAGVVDQDYRGELLVCLINHGDDAYTISPGDRIAQLIIERCATVHAFEVEEDLPATVRGAGGFGSTGMAEVA